MSYAGHKYIREGRSHGRGRLAQLACALLLPLLIFSSCGASRGNVPRSAAATVHAAAAIEFETWVLIQNPSGNPVHVDLKLQTDTGEVTPPELSGVEIAPRSRRTFRLNDYVSTYHVSTLVHARDGQVVAERAVYGGDRAWGTDSIGATAPAPDWYLAEGAAYPGAGQGMVPLTVTERSGVARDGELVTCGVPLPRDAAVYSVSELAVVSGSGAAVPLQAEITARWGGAPNDATSPAQWVLLTFPATVGAGGSAFYYLRKGGGGAAHANPVTLADDGTILTVNTGAARFELGRDSFDLLHSVEINGAGTVITPRDTNGFSLFAGGREYRSALAAPASFKVLESGPLRAVVEVEGTHAGSGGAFMHYTARLHFYAGASWVRVQYTLSNRNAPELDEYAQPLCKDIGSPASDVFQGLEMRLRPATGASTGIYLAAGEGGQSFNSSGQALSLYQDSSGTDYWDYHRGNYPRTQAYVSFRGWQARRAGSTAGSGNQAQPWLAAWGNGVGMAVGMKDFWRNCPKGIGWSDGEARLSLFPQEYAGDFSFRAGEEKTHEIFLDFFAGDPGGAGVGERMAALEDPLFGLAPPEWYAGSGAFGRMALTGGGADTAAYEDQNRAAFDPSIGGAGNSLAMSILANDFYGWCDYGDVPLDYEAPSGQMNLKYDFDHGMILQFLRTGDARWWDLAGAACRHLADEDVLHYEGEIDHWADGGYFGHSYHDEPGNDNPHRNYGAPHPDLAFGVAGGLAYYHLTGYLPARDASYEIAANIRYRYENSFGRGNGEGYAEAMNDYGSYSFRPFANGLSIMTEAYAASGDARYLATAEWIVQTSHFAADPFLAAPSSGAEGGTSIFSLDMFTASLGLFSDMLATQGQPDRQGAAAYLVQLVRHEVDNCWRAEGGYEGFPYAWHYDGTDDTSFGVVDFSNWHLLSADCLTYAWLHGGGDDLLDLAGRAFRTGSEAPNGPGTYPAYWSTKESANAASFGQVYLRATR